MFGIACLPLPPLLNPPRLTSYRIFLAEARLILAKMVWNFDMEMVKKDDWDWMDQKAYLVFEPKSLKVKLMEKSM